MRAYLAFAMPLIVAGAAMAHAVSAPVFAQAVPTRPAAAPPLEGVQQPQQAATPDDYRYLQFLPRGYRALPHQQWPIVIFLHGSGERGADVEKVRVNGPPKIIADHPGFPAILISPQVDMDQDWDTAKLDRLLAHLRRKLRVDASRIYLTGLSLGGHATWLWATERPELFAAIAPVAGWGDPASACRLKDVPVWAFHGDSDDVVAPKGSVEMVEAVKACKGAAPAWLTLYPATNHGSWVPTYDDPAFYRWLLEQRREQPAP